MPSTVLLGDVASAFSWQATSFVALLAQAALGMLPLALVDATVAYRWRAHSGRWFFLHAVINAFVVVFSVLDIVFCLGRPDICFETPWLTSWAYAMAMAGHLYHCVVFWPVKSGDLAHHVVMVFLMPPLVFLYEPYAGSQFAVFVLTGLPGGIDYVLLWLVRIGRMDSLTEKYWAVQLHTWLRAPLATFAAGFWYVSFVTTDAISWPGIIPTASVVLNALYYGLDTTRSYYGKHAPMEKRK